MQGRPKKKEKDDGVQVVVEEVVVKEVEEAKKKQNELEKYKSLKNSLDQASAIISDFVNIIEEKGVATPFQPDGAQELIDSVQDEDVFKHCQRATDLEPEQFGTDRIDTLGDLHDHLVPCNPQQLITSEMKEPTHAHNQTSNRAAALDCHCCECPGESFSFSGQGSKQSATEV